MLYRKQRAPLNLWLLLGTALLTLALGFLAGRMTAPPATLAALVAPDQQHLRQASGALDIVDLEYARALEGNAQSAAASLSAVEQAQSEVAQLQVVKQLMPAQVRAAEEALAGLERAVRQREGKSKVTQWIQDVRERLTPLSVSSPSVHLPSTITWMRQERPQASYQSEPLQVWAC
ncbi:hypothetical protein [Deinococcus humi]|uniref:Uncharacterized protein n=1 Tax=Deinococcus humi TaxID=662880 RepID=A0A7W8NG29_9DEIO|nr:hypothetical protein [Deinococcus humi]MBB5364395.1 hypothetical protein [Deinococcus humi]GGO33274.1 hypothetical protein GCM10008949_32220 [Deinococcus humi]